MKSQAILRADYLDILFDNRNKNYGGYDLRKTYHKRVKRALSVVMLSLGSAIAYPVIASNFGSHEVVPPKKVIDIILTPPPATDIKKPVELPKPQQTVAAPVHRDIFTVPEVVINEDVPDKNLMKENDKIINPGTADVTGDPGSEIAPITNNSTGGVVDVPVKTDAIVDFVEQMPEYNGDMYDFLRKHTNYPDAARESGIEGKVTVRFVVNEDGSIVNVKVVRGIGGGCDEEAVRVVSAMPKWKPGKNNGVPTRVYFTLPIIFKFD